MSEHWTRHFWDRALDRLRAERVEPHVRKEVPPMELPYGSIITGLCDRCSNWSAPLKHWRSEGWVCRECVVALSAAPTPPGKEG